MLIINSKLIEKQKSRKLSILSINHKIKKRNKQIVV